MSQIYGQNKTDNTNIPANKVGMAKTASQHLSDCNQGLSDGRISDSGINLK